MNKFVWCALDVDKEASLLFDQQVRDTCVQHLELAANASKRETSLTANASAQQRYSEEEQRRPFFIGCGFHKPHAPYYAPKEFYDRLPPHQLIPLPLDPFAPVGMPAVAWHPYADSHGMTENPGEAWQWIWQCLLSVSGWERCYCICCTMASHLPSTPHPCLVPPASVQRHREHDKARRLAPRLLCRHLVYGL